MKIKHVLRRYDSLKNFVGENVVYPCGDILYVSEKNNDDYNIILVADGKRPFRDIYKEKKEEGDELYLTVLGSKKE